MTAHEEADLAQRLLVHAARKAPGALAARLEEEWLADLQTRRGGFARWRLALGCCWATAVIARELRAPQLATSGAPRALLGELRQELPGLSRRSLVLLVSAAVQALLLYGFASGFAHRVVRALPVVSHVEFLEDKAAPRPVPPPLAHPKLLSVPLIDLTYPMPQLDLPRDDTSVTQVREVLAPPKPIPPHAVNRVAGGPGKEFPQTADFYPETSRRLEETGAAHVQVCVDTHGRLTADPVIARSSGSRRLDAAALDLARAGSGHYVPTTEDGAAVNACFAYRIRFELN